MGHEYQIQGLEVQELHTLLPTLEKATANQMKGITTVVKVHMTPDITSIFRADAMKKQYRFLQKYSRLSTGSNPFL